MQNLNVNQKTRHIIKTETNVNKFKYNSKTFTQWKAVDAELLKNIARSIKINKHERHRKRKLRVKFCAKDWAFLKIYSNFGTINHKTNLYPQVHSIFIISRAYTMIYCNKWLPKDNQKNILFLHSYSFPGWKSSQIFSMLHQLRQ